MIHTGDTKQPAVTPADSAPVQTQPTSEKGVAVAVNKKAASKLKKKQVPRKKTKELPKSLLRWLHSSPAKRAQSARRKKVNALRKRINANVLPKRTNAQDKFSVGPDDPSVMSEEAISEEHKVPTEPSNNEPPETVGAEVAEETTLTPEKIFQIELAKGPESFCKISKNLNYRAFERMITSFLFADAHVVSIVASSMQRRLCMYEADLFRKYLPGLGHPLNDIFSIQNIE